MKTGSMGRPWVELEKPKPPPVDNFWDYWGDPPPEMSERCAYWLRQMDRGFAFNRWWLRGGRDEASSRMGVYLWEYLNVILPRQQEVEVAAQENCASQKGRPGRARFGYHGITR